MEITYEKIIAYLTSTQKNCIFPLEIGSFENSFNFPKYLSSLFLNKLNRTGVIQKPDKKFNVSMISSILYCLDCDYYSYDRNNMLACINTFKQKLIDDLLDKSNNFYNKFSFKKLGWSKSFIIDKIKEKTLTNHILYFISCYFDINIFIFDTVHEEIKVIYNENYFNKYKSNIILYKKENQYEPITDNNNNTKFNYYDDIIKILLNNSNLIIVDTTYSNNKSCKNFLINDKPDTLIPISNENYNNKSNNNSDEESDNESNNNSDDETDNESDNESNDETDNESDNESNDDLKNESKDDLKNESKDDNLKYELKDELKEETVKEITNKWRDYSNVTLMKRTKEKLLDLISELKEINREEYIKLTKKKLVEILKSI